MVRPEGALLDSQSLAKQAFGFGVSLKIELRLSARLARRQQFVLALLLQHVGQVVHAGCRVRVFRSQHFFAYRERATVHRFGFLELALQVQHIAQIGQTGRGGRMLFAQRFFVNRNHAIAQGLRLPVLAVFRQLLRARAQLLGILARSAPGGLAELSLQVQHPPEVGKRGGRVLMLFPQGFFQDTQSAAQQRFGVRVIAQFLQHQRQIVERGRRTHIIRTQPLLIDI